MIKRIALTILVEDSLNKWQKNQDMKAEHGLSILIELSEPKLTVLMDTGQSPTTLLHNMQILGVNPNEINTIFLSHGHYDHTGGLPVVPKQLNRTIPVIAHPDVFNPKFKLGPSIKYIGSPFDSAHVKSWGGVPLLARNPVTIARGVLTTGEIERTTLFEETKGFWTVKKDTFVEDLVKDDQALILNVENKGLVVISGCAHAGIINTVNQAKRLLAIEKVYAVIGGFHLIKASGERIKSTITNLVRIDPDLIGPCHCTGTKAIKEIARVFGKRCKPLRTGERLVL